MILNPARIDEIAKKTFYILVFKTLNILLIKELTAFIAKLFPGHILEWK